MLNCKPSKQNKKGTNWFLNIKHSKGDGFGNSWKTNVYIRIHMVKQAVKQNAVWTGLHFLLSQIFKLRQSGSA